MTDMSLTIAPKSDQLNSDDLISGPRTICITRVSANPDSAEQPVSVFFEGDGGKPYKPCKSMRRVMVAVWGADGSAYAGRAMTIYRDPEVAFGGMKVGGIRISHMSEMQGPMTLALTATRATRKPYTVKPLAMPKPAPAVDHLADARHHAGFGTQAFRAWWTARSKAENAPLMPHIEELKAIAAKADAATADPFAPDPTATMTPDEIEAKLAEVAAEFGRAGE